MQAAQLNSLDDVKRTARVVIQDIVVAGIGPATGEFDPGTHSNPEPSDQMLDRLFNKVNGFISKAAGQHRATNCEAGSNQLKAGCENNVTRLAVNEFFFYTKQPLSINEFQQLLQRINDNAKNQPENLHLVLASFAVSTPNGKVMNVVPQIQCGRDPIVNLTVKNIPSSIDPVYTSVDKDGLTKPLPNVFKVNNDKIDQLAISIDGKPHPFDFNCALKYKTSGGAEYNACIDICLDHRFGVASKSMEAMILSHFANGCIEPISTQCAHMIVSNTISIIPENVIGSITHADPVDSEEHSKPNVAKIGDDLLNGDGFGGEARMITTAPAVCGRLSPELLSMVTIYNQHRDAISKTPKDTLSATATELALDYFSRIVSNKDTAFLSTNDQTKKVLDRQWNSSQNTLDDPYLLPNQKASLVDKKRGLYQAAEKNVEMQFKVAQKSVLTELQPIISQIINAKKMEWENFLKTSPPDDEQKNQIARNMISEINSVVSKYQDDLIGKIINEFEQSLGNINNSIKNEVDKLVELTKATAPGPDLMNCAIDLMI